MVTFTKLFQRYPTLFQRYADDSTLAACEKILYDVQRKLESESLILFGWFHDNYLKANSGKSHVMLTTDNKLKII